MIMVMKKALKKKVVRKKAVKQKVSKKKKAPSLQVKKVSSERITNSNVERILVENFVALQKVMVNLSVKIEDLTTKTSKLFELFELSAKSLAEKDSEAGQVEKDDKEMIGKLDNLFEQNKVIARGLTLLHEREPGVVAQRPPIKRPLQANPPAGNLGEGYQKSISSKFKKLPENA